MMCFWCLRKFSFFRFFRWNCAGGGLSDNGEKLLWRKIKQSLTKFDILEVQTLKKFGPWKLPISTYTPNVKIFFLTISPVKPPYIFKFSGKRLCVIRYWMWNRPIHSGLLPTLAVKVLEFVNNQIMIVVFDEWWQQWWWYLSSDDGIFRVMMTMIIVLAKVMMSIMIVFVKW